MTDKYKIMALDLDDTLLDDDKKISPMTLNALLDIQKAGMKIVLASGRPTYGLEKYAKELRLLTYGGYLVSYSGGKVTSCLDNTILVRNTIDLNLIPRIYDIVKSFDLPLLSYKRNSIITEDDTNEAVLQESMINNGMKIEGVRDFVSAVDRPPFKCVVMGSPVEIAQVRHALECEFPNQLSFHNPAPFLLDIVPFNVDKANALDFLLKDLDLDKSQLVAVGDSYNDVGMIQMAGLGVAMANATEAVKQCASYVTKSNNEDGIVHLINKHILGEEGGQTFTPEALNALMHNTLMSSIGIQCTLLQRGRVEATMPVDIRTRQPMGILHGGASLALAETVAGIGSILLLDENEIQVGMQVSGNHISSAHEGEVVKAIATIIHQGRSSHVWNVDVVTQSQKLISSVRVVNSILKKR